MKPETSKEQVLDTDVNLVLAEIKPDFQDIPKKLTIGATTLQEKVKKAKLTFIEYFLNKLRLCCR